jgi:RimJ/RimL family protein N-acetyltransferase
MLAARVEQKNGTYLNDIQRDRQFSPRPTPVAVFGICPDRHSHWGRGYMTEAVRALARAVFGRGPHDAIFSGAFTDNAASLRVQEKTGFVRDGDTMLHARPRGSDFPHINTALTRSRFESRSS